MRNATKVDPRINSIAMRLGYARCLACFNEFVNRLSNFPLVYMCSGAMEGACNLPREHGYDLPYGAVGLPRLCLGRGPGAQTRRLGLERPRPQNLEDLS